jgi:pyruvate/2-oxoglutarate dehydrogenase complex dihydrolipoamide dehydrogenase (E3) component
MTAVQSQLDRRIASPAEAAQTYRTLPASRYDLIIIGGGSAGLPAAQIAAALGARVALVDRDKLGGECLHTGCVPSKALLRIARVAAEVRTAGQLGLSARLNPVDLSAVADRVHRVIDQIYVTSDAPERFIAQGVDVALGEVRFLARDRLAVNGQTVTARRYLICTGSHPTVPPIAGLAEAGFLTNESVFDLRHLPASLVVIGGGPIGCELGQAFARLGARVTIVEALERLLPQDEPAAAQVLQARLAAEGVTILTRAHITGVSHRGGRRIVAASTPDARVEIATEQILVAAGRAPNVAGLDLEAAGVRYDAKKGIAANAYLRTSNPRIYAAGDVTGGYHLTHAAALHARKAVRNALIPLPSKLDARVMPWTTFTEPEIAHVGLTEAQARQQHGDRVRVYTQAFHDVDRAVVEGETAGFVKLVGTRGGKLLGAQIVGPAAGEYINEVALAMQRGLGLGDLANTTHVYPTLAIAIQQAAAKYNYERLAHSRVVKLLRALAR